MSNETTNTSGIIGKVWSYCNALRDDGVGRGDYLEQPACLLFLNMADEHSLCHRTTGNCLLPGNTIVRISPPDKGAEPESHYTTLLRELSHSKAILGQIFIKSQNKIQDTAGVRPPVFRQTTGGRIRRLRAFLDDVAADTEESFW